MSTVTQPSLQLPSCRDGPAPPSLCAGELHGGKGLEGTPRLQKTVQLHLEVQPLADRLVSTQLASSEAEEAGLRGLQPPRDTVQCQHRRFAPLRAQPATKAAEALFAEMGV